MRSILLTLLLVLGVPAHAALVDNGSYTSDTVSNLDWLDLDQSIWLTLSNAEASRPGWRLASNDELEDLFLQLFDGYYNEHPDGHCSSCYTGQREDARSFTSLFGYTQDQSYANRTLAYGLYIDEDGVPRMMGVIADYTFYSSTIFGMDSIKTSGVPYSVTTSGRQGIYLVRTSAVPVPAAFWLFGSALAGLGWLKRKQTV